MNSLNLTLRQRNILYILQNQASWVTSGEIAARLRVSSRTIRNDIAEMNLMLAPFQAEIVSVQSKGFSFRAKNPELIRRISRIDTAVFSRTERIRYLAIRLCQSDEPVNLYDLEDEVFISRTALMSDIRALREKYTYSDPHIRLTQKGDEIYFENDELKIRSVLLNLFHEGWDYNAHGNAYYGYHFLDEDLMHLLMDETSRILYRYKIQMDDPTLIALELTLAIMHHRCLMGHPYPEDPEIPDKSTPSWKAAGDLFELIQGQTGSVYPETEKCRIYEFIRSSRLHPADLQFQAVPFGRGWEEASEAAALYLAEIRNTFSVDFSEDTDFVHILTMFLRQLKSGHTIFSQHSNFREIKEMLSAEYELAYLFQSLSQDYMGRFLGDNELCNLAIAFGGAIRQYLKFHPEMKLRAVLFSHRNMAAAWGFARQILETYQDYIEITDILPVNFKDNFDPSDTDLILSTVKKKISDSARATSLILDDLPSSDLSGYAMEIKLLSFQKIWPMPSLHTEQLFDGAFWRENADARDRFRLIQEMAGDFIREGICEESHLADITEREALVSFAIKPGVVFLFTTRPAKETRLSFVTLRHSLKWNGFKICLAVMAVMRKEDLNLLFRLKIRFCYHTYDTDELMRLKTKEELLPYLK